MHGSVYDHVDGRTAERQTDAGEDEPFDSNREHSSVCQDENLTNNERTEAYEEGEVNHNCSSSYFLLIFAHFAVGIGSM